MLIVDRSIKDDTMPFPVQQSPSCRGPNGKIIKPAQSSIPLWLAREVYEGYVLAHGNIQSLGRIAERGGFGREEVLYYLRYAELQEQNIQGQ